MKRATTEERRRQIVDGLLTVMSERGYAKATIGRIADAAGLTQGLVHYHFKNKQEILTELLARLVDDYIESLDPVWELEDARDQLSRWISLTLNPDDGNDPETVASWVVICAEAIRQPELREPFVAAINATAAPLKKIVKRGRSDGVFKLPRGDVDSAVAAILATINGYFVLAASARETIPIGSASDATQKMASAILREIG